MHGTAARDGSVREGAACGSGHGARWIPRPPGPSRGDRCGRPTSAPRVLWVATRGRPDIGICARGSTTPKGRLQLAVLDLDAQENYEGLEQRRIEGASAWVPIQRGCNHRCTFCIVPYVRGPEKNRSPADVLDEVATLAERGVTEVTLLGQTVNSYRHGGWSFSRLLREVARVPRIRRVRFTSPHPCDVTEELAEVMATEIAVCEQLHLPVQSGSDRTLRRMLRRYDRRGFLETVEMVRRVVPDVALSTDVIVGVSGRDPRGLPGDSLTAAGGPLRRRVHVPIFASRWHARDPHAGRLGRGRSRGAGSPRGAHRCRPVRPARGECRARRARGRGARSKRGSQKGTGPRADTQEQSGRLRGQSRVDREAISGSAWSRRRAPPSSGACCRGRIARTGCEPLGGGHGGSARPPTVRPFCRAQRRPARNTPPRLHNSLWSPVDGGSPLAG